MAQKHINPIQNREQVIRCAEDNFTDLYANKQDKLSAQTAYSAKGTSTKVPQITTNSLGQVTGITEVNIDGYTKSEVDTKIANIVNTTSANVSTSELINITGKENGANYAVKDSQAVINRVRGVTYAYNNKCAGAVGGGHCTTIGSQNAQGFYDSIRYDGVQADSYFYFKTTDKLVENHIYFIYFNYTGTLTSGSFAINNASSYVMYYDETEKGFHKIFTCPSNMAGATQILIDDYARLSSATDFSNFVCVDLSLWFGRNKEPSTDAEVLKRIPQIRKGTLSYSNGKLVHSNNEIISHSSNILPLGTIYSYYGGALYSNGTYGTYSYDGNEIECTKSVSSSIAGFKIEVPIGTTNLNVKYGSLVGTTVCLCYYVCKDEQERVVKSQTSANVNTTGVSISIPSNTKYVLFGIGNSNILYPYKLVAPMVTLGSTAYPYVQSNEDNILGIGELRGAGNMADEISMSKKTVRTAILNTSTITTISKNDATSDNYLYYIALTNGSVDVTDVVSSRFATASNATSGTSVSSGCINISSRYNVLYLNLYGLITTNDVTTALAYVKGLATDICYPIKDEVVTDFEMQGGIAVWENGLQYQKNKSNTVQAPYIIDKTYALNIGQQLINNIYTDLAEEKRLDDIDENTVHTTGNENIGGDKYFFGGLKLKSTTQEIGTTPSAVQWRFIEYLDKNNSRVGVIGSRVGTDGRYGVYLQAGNLSGVNLITNGTTTEFFSSTTSGTTNLGASSNQWNRVYAVATKSILESPATTRLSSPDIDLVTSNTTGVPRMRLDMRSSSMSSATGDPGADGFIQTYQWDNSTYKSQLYIPLGYQIHTNGVHLKVRGQNPAGSSSWSSTWKELAYTSDLDSYVKGRYINHSTDNAKYTFFAQEATYSSIGGSWSSATYLIAGLGYPGSHFQGTYLVTVSSRGNTPHIDVKCLQQPSSGTTTFGYYTSGTTAYYGVYSAQYNYQFRVMLLGKTGGFITEIDTSVTSAPSGWTTTTTKNMSTASFSLSGTTLTITN